MADLTIDSKDIIDMQKVMEVVYDKMRDDIDYSREVQFVKDESIEWDRYNDSRFFVTDEHFNCRCVPVPEVLDIIEGTVVYSSRKPLVLKLEIIDDEEND